MNSALITGIGVVTSLGIGKEIFWEKLKTKQHGIKKISIFDASPYITDKAGECDFIDEIEFRAAALMFPALKEALDDSNISLEMLQSTRIKIFIGSGYGDGLAWQNAYQGKEEKNKNKDFYIYDLGNQVLDYLQIKAPVRHVSTACSSSTVSVGLGKRAIENEECDLAIVIGVDVICDTIQAAFSSFRALTRTLCRPFDKDRDGTIMGEGAGCCIIESKKNASQRKTKQIYAKISGFGTGNDAVHLTSPAKQASGAIVSIKRAFSESNISPEDISFINPHGTGTRFNDPVECFAINNIFKEKAATIPISSIKSSIGHTSGACGIIEVILICLTMKNGYIIPILNYSEPLKNYNFNFINELKKIEIKNAISINSAFGGHNACLILEKEVK